MVLYIDSINRLLLRKKQKKYLMEQLFLELVEYWGLVVFRRSLCGM